MRSCTEIDCCSENETQDHSDERGFYGRDQQSLRPAVARGSDLEMDISRCLCFFQYLQSLAEEASATDTDRGGSSSSAHWLESVLNYTDGDHKQTSIIKPQHPDDVLTATTCASTTVSNHQQEQDEDADGSYEFSICAAACLRGEEEGEAFDLEVATPADYCYDNDFTNEGGAVPDAAAPAPEPTERERRPSSITFPSHLWELPPSAFLGRPSDETEQATPRSSLRDTEKEEAVDADFQSNGCETSDSDVQRNLAMQTSANKRTRKASAKKHRNKTKDKGEKQRRKGASPGAEARSDQSPTLMNIKWLTSRNDGAHGHAEHTTDTSGRYRERGRQRREEKKQSRSYTVRSMACSLTRSFTKTSKLLRSSLTLWLSQGRTGNDESWSSQESTESASYFSCGAASRIDGFDPAAARADGSLAMDQDDPCWSSGPMLAPTPAFSIASSSSFVCPPSTSQGKPTAPSVASTGKKATPGGEVDKDLSLKAKNRKEPSKSERRKKKTKSSSEAIAMAEKEKKDAKKQLHDKSKDHEKKHATSKKKMAAGDAASKAPRTILSQAISKRLSPHPRAVAV